MKKYWRFFKINLSANLEYRGALFTWLLVELIGLTSAIFVWTAVFEDNKNVGGYDFQQIMSYFILLPLIGSFTSVFISDHLPKKIKDGQISSELIKPYSIGLQAWINQLTIKLTHMTIKLPVYITVGYFLVSSFNLSFSMKNVLLSFLFCIPAYILHALIDLSLSYSSFWFEDVWSLSLLKRIALMVFGGLSFPLDLVPEKFRDLFTILPFRFIYYFPVKIAQGSYTAGYLYNESFQLGIWILVLILIGKILWKQGIRKYSAYGN